MGARLIRLRYDGTCARCGSAVPAGERGWWNREAKKVRCQTCGPDTAASVEPAIEQQASAAIDVGVAGASARAEYERRKRCREETVRARHPRVGRFILAVTDEPQATKAWAQGSVGEQRVGATLDELIARGAVVLHDRRIPGTKANIDHIVVAPSGVWIVDAKNYRGEVGRRDVGGLFLTDVRLYVGRRDCTKLIAGMAKQVAAVQRALDGASIPTRPVLCFTEAEWSLFAKPFELDGVLIIWPKSLIKVITNVSASSVDVPAVASRIAERLPVAQR
ncbi:MAG: NERD domain-containing protein [Actinomycetota bacterium]|nr:NERD domain-containing protein [Actinomycetota bacterium]